MSRKAVHFEYDPLLKRSSSAGDSPENPILIEDSIVIEDSNAASMQAELPEIESIVARNPSNLDDEYNGDDDTKWDEDKEQAGDDIDSYEYEEEEEEEEEEVEEKGEDEERLPTLHEIIGKAATQSPSSQRNVCPGGTLAEQAASSMTDPDIFERAIRNSGKAASNVAAFGAKDSVGSNASSREDAAVLSEPIAVARISIDSSIEWEVTAVTDRRVVGSTIEYFVHWKPCWMPINQLSCDRLIKVFNQNKHGEKRRRESRCADRKKALKTG